VHDLHACLAELGQDRSFVAVVWIGGKDDDHHVLEAAPIEAAGEMEQTPLVTAGAERPIERGNTELPGHGAPQMLR
jgi:hypothetical protein